MSVQTGLALTRDNKPPTEHVDHTHYNLCLFLNTLIPTCQTVNYQIEIEIVIFTL